MNPTQYYLDFMASTRIVGNMLNAARCERPETFDKLATACRHAEVNLRALRRHAERQACPSLDIGDRMADELQIFVEEAERGFCPLPEVQALIDEWENYRKQPEAITPCPRKNTTPKGGGKDA